MSNASSNSLFLSKIHQVKPLNETVNGAMTLSITAFSIMTLNITLKIRHGG